MQKKARSCLRTLVTEIKQCGNKKDLQRGKLLHCIAVEAGCHNNTYVSNTLIYMYGKCGSIQDAKNVFDNMTRQDVVSWTTLINGYVENGESLVALDMYKRMNCTPNSYTFVSVLKACSVLPTCLQKVMSIHTQAKEIGLDKDVFVASALVDLYSKCGSMKHARDVFQRMTQRDVVSWTALILGYVENGENLVGLDVFATMECAPNHLTFVAALKACSGLAREKQFESLQKGRAVHRQARERGFDKDVLVANALVDMYGKCGSMSDAKLVFASMIRHDVVSWNSLMLGYVANGEGWLALEVYASMDSAPNHITFVAALKAAACGEKKSCIQNTAVIHRRARELGLDKNVFVASVLVDVYSKCGSMRDAHDAFESMNERSLVSWNSLILGYVENGESLAALDVYRGMDCAPNCCTFAAVLKACANIGALETGVRIHCGIRGLGLEQDEMVGTCLVDFYGKCNRMDLAEEVFRRMRCPDVVCWNALLGGYSLSGDTSRVFSVVGRMQEACVGMDGVTFTLVLTTCSHAGMVEEALHHFHSMLKHGVSPGVEHYACVVDVLCRANRLQEALLLAESMPFEADFVVWMTLLGACSKWGNVEVGESVFSVLVSKNVDKERVAAAYVLMGDIYSKVGMHKEEEHVKLQ